MLTVAIKNVPQSSSPAERIVPITVTQRKNMDLLHKDSVLAIVSLKKKNIKHTCSIFKTEYMTYHTET